MGEWGNIPPPLALARAQLRVVRTTNACVPHFLYLFDFIIYFYFNITYIGERGRDQAMGE